ncbi:Formin-like protein [Quillaja saponaria]|uniref:Formin-like protein n=1 Tax=Quillaja saponaria TaxID=32244 RepID=A0AAD7LFA4_QUISA|nr:Formin-like protein [Quillaja saponaria]
MPQPSHIVAKAVAATAATMLGCMGIFFFLFYKYVIARRCQKNKVSTSFHREAVADCKDIEKVRGSVKGLIVEENGMDVLYMRNLEGGQVQTIVPNVILNESHEDNVQEKRVDAMKEESKPQEIPMHSKSSDVHALEDIVKPVLDISTLPPPVSAILPSRQDLPQSPQPRLKCPPPPPLPPPPMMLAKQIQPHPPSPSQVNEVPVLPLLRPPPNLSRNGPAAPPPPPSKISGLFSSLKPPHAPKVKANSNNTAETTTWKRTKDTGGDQMKLKPLHWDKVIANVDHSTVWDQINDGSFRFDDDLMENLFGYATNNKSSERSNIPSTSSKTSYVPSSQVFILEQRKSQNTTIVLRSLGMSCKEILDALLHDQELSADALEKLTKVAPTDEEQAKIIHFSGNPTKLADAESFLYHILKAVPTAFARVKAMLFRSNYDCEILQLKESLQTLELGCKELRSRGLFLKLLEAILKAGNRMNAGTVRGNAQAFNLSALRKLSDVRSTDGKTNLLHFVVEQVVRSEGRRHVINQNHGLPRSNSQKSKSGELNSEERDSEYLMCGLSVLGALNVELSEVKKAANIEYDSFISICSRLGARVADIWQVITYCDNGDGGGFVQEMKGFLEECEEELQVVNDDQTRILDLVKRTTEYYLAGVSKDKFSNPFHLFALVNEFLDMVGQVCLELNRKLQKKKAVTNFVTLPPSSPPVKPPLIFPNFELRFMSSMPATTSCSQLEDDF